MDLFKNWQAYTVVNATLWSATQRAEWERYRGLRSEAGRMVMQNKNEAVLREYETVAHSFRTQRGDVATKHIEFMEGTHRQPPYYRRIWNSRRRRTRFIKRWWWNRCFIARLFWNPNSNRLLGKQQSGLGWRRIDKVHFLARTSTPYPIPSTKGNSKLL